MLCSHGQGMSCLECYDNLKSLSLENESLKLQIENLKKEIQELQETVFFFYDLPGLKVHDF